MAAIKKTKARRSNFKASTFETLTLEGGLISSAMLAAVAAREASEQSEKDYAIARRLSLRDEIPRAFRIGQGLMEQLMACATPSLAATTEFTTKLLRTVFGFDDIRTGGERTLAGRSYVVSLEACGDRVPIVVVPPSDSLDRVSEHLRGDGRRRSAATAIQDWLNANESALWGFCCNGERLRLVRDNASLTRPAYFEVDLRRMFETEAYADFNVLWLLIHATRFGRPGTAVEDCILERWREDGAKQGLAARDRLRDGVQEALRALGTGFLSHGENQGLRSQIQAGALPLTDFFGELLRLVYCLIFLLTAEDRGLLHPPEAQPGPRRLYREGYSLGALRDRSVRRAAYDRYHDQWEGLLIVLQALAEGDDRLALPALGGLFSPESLAVLTSLRLSNRSLLEAMYRLAWLRDDDSLVPVNWRDMETEELGSVYESLLELTPRLSDEGRELSFADGFETKGNARKTTGSYYTPDSLVQTLLDSTLDPLLDRVEASSTKPIDDLLKLSVIDPACGSGHFLLAAARRIATRVARLRSGGVASADDFRHAMRDVARSCIYGVDRNPMAVELTKVALWIETVEPGKPLGFLDATIRCGDSLLGLCDLRELRDGIPDEAYNQLTGDDKLAVKSLMRHNRDERTLGKGEFDFSGQSSQVPEPPRFDGAARVLHALPEDSKTQVLEKRRLYEEVIRDRELQRWRDASNMYVAAFLLSKESGSAVHGQARIPTTSTIWKFLAKEEIPQNILEGSTRITKRAEVFHWPLEFPEVFAEGGFDAVVGNPPWEVMQLNEQEYFSQEMPEIASLAGSKRKAEIAKLEHRFNDVFSAFQAEKRIFEAINDFMQASRRFPLTSKGKPNSYAKFAELAASLIKSSGRSGLIVPTGIATDATTAPFFASLVEQKRLAQLIDFENRAKLFAAVDSRMKFCILVFGTGVEKAEFSFFLTSTAQLGDQERRFSLSPNEIAMMNPNTKTAPVFRSRADAELAAKIYSRVPVLIDESKGDAGNPWGIEFRQGLFNMTSDSGLFRTAEQLRSNGYVREGVDWIKPDADNDRERRYVPLYEAKMFDFYDHRFSSYGDRGNERGYRVLPPTTIEQHSDLSYEVESFYFAGQQEVEFRIPEWWEHKWLLAFGNVISPTNERTICCSIIPRCAVGHSSPLIFSKIDPARLILLYANLNALVLDYIARTKVGGVNLSYFYLKQLPVIALEHYRCVDISYLTSRILELTYTSLSMSAFAEDIGYSGSSVAWDEGRRAKNKADIDAWYARAYGLTRDELRFVLDPSEPFGETYPSETFRVLKSKEIAEYGEYRTARLILAAWDEQEADMLALSGV